MIPYWPRADIESGKAPGRRQKALVSTSTIRVEAFFLQIQGSGRVRLAEGGIMRVGYADQNGHPFRSIGRLLVERGEAHARPRIDAGHQGLGPAQSRKARCRSSTRIRATSSFAKSRRPRRARSKREIDGPIGTLGVPLLRERTIAVDPRSIPLGAPVYLATTYPLSTRPLHAADAGAGHRAARFAAPCAPTSSGASATTPGAQAGRMKQDGRMWLLWPRDAGRPHRSRRPILAPRERGSAAQPASTSSACRSA